jgi:hypothetical protein
MGEIPENRTHAKSNNIFHVQATGPRTRKCAPFTSAMNDQMLDESALARFPICGGLCFQRRGEKGISSFSKRGAGRTLSRTVKKIV